MNDGLAAVVEDEPYDLLDPETYQSTEAAAYFQSLEEEMTARRMSLKPSNSHLGTTSRKEAATWGTAASIWPLGQKEIGYAWLEEGGLFWPIDERNNGTKRRKIVEANIRNNYGVDNRGLANALQVENEIMFRADSGFLAVPAELDDELRSRLMEINEHRHVPWYGMEGDEVA